MDEAHRTIAREIYQCIHDLRKLTHRRHHHLAQQHGLTVSQFHVLRRLVRVGEPISVGELAKHTHSALSTVSELVKRMEEKGLVYRFHSPSDKRITLVSGTPKSEQLRLEIHKDAGINYYAQALDRLGEEASTHLRDLLRVFKEALEEM